MPPDLAGRTAIVTGASRGIGLATARSLRRAGAKVVLTARTAAAAEEAAAELGAGAAGYGAHAADADAAAACVAFAIERFGRLDVLVNNAGTNPAYGPAAAAERSAAAKTFEVNMWAPTLWSGAAWLGWMREHGGAIVNVASIGAFRPDPQLGIYNASKAGLLQLTRQLALELAPLVRVNAVAPGVVRTRLAEALWREHEPELVRRTPLGRIGEPADVGAAVAFLASEEAGWITGSTLVVDGGQLLGGEAA
ncbi:MAG TPA: SDR family oxidoreductase [Solirubrobacterales bacterium]|nr:SDR family oxidoreductase [Solirubrobacterales bacterium]